MASISAGFEFVYQLPEEPLPEAPWRPFRLRVVVIIAVIRLGKPVRRHERLAARLSIRTNSGRVRRRRLVEVGITILCVVSLSSRIERMHATCLPLYVLLSTIDSLEKNHKPHLLLSAGKCTALLVVLSFVKPHLNIFKSLILEHRSSTRLSTAELSGCYYALEDMCRPIAKCVAYISGCQGLGTKISNILDGANTIKLIVSEIDACLRVFLIILGESSVFRELSSDFRVPPLPMSYLQQYLQHQADTDRSKLVSRLGELSTGKVGGEKDISNVLSQLEPTSKPRFTFKWSFWRREIPGVSELSQLLIGRIEYDNMERLGIKTADMHIAFQQRLWVEKSNITTVRAIGSGSFGMVHEVECFREKYAMKTIWTNRIEDDKEALLHAGLQHPHIVKLIWYTTGYQRNNSLSLLMELMRMGLNDYLESRVHEKKPPLAKTPLIAVDLMLQIAEAMKYLHSEGIMHRDLKSSNVLVDFHPDSDGYLIVKLCDFGLAKQKEDQAISNTSNVGTSFWRAPEVLSTSCYGEKTCYSYPADVYSFAMTCYEILTSKRPYADEQEENLKWRISSLHLRPPLPEGEMHPDLVLLIKQCWDANPDQRPTFDFVYEKLLHVKQQLQFGKVL